jgi:hypothetical protein
MAADPRDLFGGRIDLKLALVGPLLSMSAAHSPEWATS